MSIKKAGLIFIVGLSAFFKTHGQCTTTDFSLPATGCAGQKLTLTNSSTGSNFLWDFCSGDFNNAPTAKTTFTLTGSNGRPGLELMNDNGVWIGLATGTYSNALYRMHFDNGLANDPATIENLGDLSGKLNGPGPIKIFQDHGLWYGLVYNTVTGELLKLSFGSHLTGVIAVTTLTTITSPSNPGVFIGKDPVEGWVAAISNTANQLSLFRLGTSITSPAPSDIITTASVPNPNNLGDIDVTNVCGNWFGFAANFGNGNIYRFKFGTDLFSNPVIDQVISLPVSNPSKIRIVREGEDFFLLVTTLDGVLYRLNFGSDLTSTPTVFNDGNMGGILQPNLFALAAVKENSTWTVRAIDLSNGNTYLIQYPNNCSANTSISTSTNPTIFYSAPGNYQVALQNSDLNGISVKSKMITITGNQAPDITFSTLNNCANSNVMFTSTNQSGNIVSYAWNFGDTQTASSAAPSHAYSAASTYYPSLTVTASNGCQNLAQDTLQIFNPPSANFNLPPASPICTNQPYSFTNTSTYDAGSNPTWQWSVNGSNWSTTQNLNYTILAPAPQTIQLTASIPGCSSQSTQAIPSVLTGPAVTFSTAATGCVNNVVSFSNSTSGLVTGYSWTFGDGNTSVQTNPSNTYLGTGTYVVTLNAVNAAGCQNSYSKNISIYSNPQPKFTIEAPPFSCANYPAQFDNNTGFLTDSNITSWLWSFGDAANGSSIVKNPAYTYTGAGNYSVSLKATTNFGCTATKDSVITILASPQAGFANGVACLNQNTLFTNTSSGNIASYNWYFPGSAIPVSGANPPPVKFTSSGANNVTLLVTGINGCINTFAKTINVPVMPVVDFSVQFPCTRNATVFTELNPGGVDPAVSWSWNFGPANGSGSPANYTFSTPGGYSVTMNTTRQSGCVYALTKNVSIYDGPIAAFTPSAYAGAAPLNVTFANTSTANTYLWQFGDAANSTSTSISPVFTYSQLGQYKALLTAYNLIGCTDTLSTWISVVVPKPNATLKSFLLAANPGANTANPVLSILNSGNVPLVNPEVDIDLGGGAMLKETIVGIIQPQQTISSTLDLQVVSNSVPYVCAQVVVPDDVNPANGKACVSWEGDIVLEPYPNPASGLVHFNWITTTNENVQITLFKSDGAIAFQQDFQHQPVGLTQFSLPVSSLANGLYLIRFSNASMQKTFRIVVAN
ncbi:MAG: PKD domain-containing protein [Bacteroidetes bacterium]|nr:PKD domain-containing protein [Bacteroidota bacterium]MBS1980081.1 PKD domain-containing protein [Bacteroidota bacterium]